jgi:hypothetical protein
MVNGLHLGACEGYQEQATSFYKLKADVYSGGNKASIIALRRAGTSRTPAFPLLYNGIWIIGLVGSRRPFAAPSSNLIKSPE